MRQEERKEKGKNRKSVGEYVSSKLNPSVTIGITKEGFEIGRQFVESILRKSRISEEMILEDMLIFETIFAKLSQQYEGEDVSMRVSVQRGASVKIKITFEGEVAVLEQTGSSPSPEDRILNAYMEKVDFVYNAGYNRIIITVNRNYKKMLRDIVMMMIAAAVIGSPMSVIIPDRSAWISWHVLFPIVDVYIKIILMLAAPVTFFSMLKNITDIYIAREIKQGIGRLHLKSIATSAIAIMIALFVSLTIARAISGTNIKDFFRLETVSAFEADKVQLIPSSIFQPFEDLSPFPMLILALLTAYTFCAVGKHFAKLKSAVDIGYSLFTNMLSMVMHWLPFFSFIALLHYTCLFGTVALVELIAPVFTIAIGCLLLMVCYVTELRATKIKGVRFLLDLRTLLRENISIGSVIAAVPYNIRYCTKHLGMDRNRLEETMTSLAQVKLDGNCFVITLFSVFLLALVSNSFSLLDLCLVGVLVFFLSFGAPNQPGSTLIGLVIVLNYMNATPLLPLAICAEAMFGWLQNIINVLSGVVMAAIDSPPGEKYRITNTR